MQARRTARLILFAAAAVALSCGLAARLHAAGRVQLELVGSGEGSAMVFQQWMQTLSEAGIRNVRIRSSGVAAKVGIEVQGTEPNRLYVVTGILKSNDELELPSGRFRRRDAPRLAAWLEELAELGPEDQREPIAAFGLTQKQFDAARKDLARKVPFSTKGITRRKALDEIGRRLDGLLEGDAKSAKALEADKIAEELSGLSCGTVLAYVLRPAGYCLVPQHRDGKTVYVVTRSKPGLEVWPVGWEPEQPVPKVLPAMYELHNINVENVSATTALGAIAGRLKVPVLVDHSALARHGIEPDKVMVSHPQSRTTYSTALGRILFQAELKSELRVDEADKPLLWVTTVKPM